MEKYGKDQFSLHTDLAVEERESYQGDAGEISGVELREWTEGKVHLTEVIVKNKTGEKKMGKPQGSYLTLEAPELAKKDEDFHREVSEILAGEIRRLLKKRNLWKDHAPDILTVGLGNRSATPDSLGPLVLENLQMTRHFKLEYGEEYCRRNGCPILSGIIPGVMAQTGMETSEILGGIIKKTRPDAVLIVDSLAARNVSRLGTTIQLSDAGIHPGAGVGNNRNRLTEDAFGVPVLAVGVPTVVGAAAIVQSTVGAMTEILKRESLKESGEQIESMSPEEQYELIRELIEPQFGPMYVTPHNIDERIQTLSFTISEAIHGALFQ